MDGFGGGRCVLFSVYVVSTTTIYSSFSSHNSHIGRLDRHIGFDQLQVSYQTMGK